MKQTHGWVLQNKYTKKFVKGNCGESKVLRLAYVFSTRKRARYSILYLPGDIVRKVSLNRNDRAEAIILGR